jgi:WD40 repeat protein
MVRLSQTAAGRKRRRGNAGGRDSAYSSDQVQVVEHEIPLAPGEGIIGVTTSSGADLVVVRENGLIEWRSPRYRYHAESVLAAHAAVRGNRTITAAAFLAVPGGLLLALGDAQGQVHFYDALQAVLLESVWTTRGTAVASLAFRPLGERLEEEAVIACASKDGKLRLFRGPAAVGDAYHAARGVMQAAWYLERTLLIAPNVPLQCLDWSRSGDAVAVGTADGQVRLLSLPSGKSETIALLKSAGKALSIESLSWNGAETGGFLATGDASGRVLFWSLDPWTRGKALAVCESFENCHGAITHLRILGANLVLFGSADGSVGFLQRLEARTPWFVSGRPQRLHRRAVRTSCAVRPACSDAFGIATGADDALLCLISDVARHLESPEKVTRYGALRAPGQLRVSCWPSSEGSCFVADSPVERVLLQCKANTRCELCVDRYRFTTQALLAAGDNGSASLTLGHLQGAFCLFVHTGGAALYALRKHRAERIPLSEKKAGILKGAMMGAAVHPDTFVVLASDKIHLHVLFVQETNTTSQWKTRVRSLRLQQADACCLLGAGENELAVAYRSGVVERFTLEISENHHPELRTQQRMLLSAPACALFLDSPRGALWTIDSDHILAENGEKKVQLPQPTVGCYYLLRGGPGSSLLAATRSCVLQIDVPSSGAYRSLYTCRDCIWGLNYASAANALLVVHGADSYAADLALDEALGRKRFGMERRFRGRHTHIMKSATARPRRARSSMIRS